MKKTWTALCLAALMVLPLAGCADKGSTGGHETASPSPMVSPSPMAPGDTLDDMVHDGTDDLAGADGIVGDETEGAVNDAAPGRSGRSALENVGDGIRDTLDDMGRGARNALDDMGDAARQVGQKTKQALQ